MNEYFVAAYQNRIQPEKGLFHLITDKNNATESNRPRVKRADESNCMRGHVFSASKGQLIKITKSTPDFSLLRKRLPNVRGSCCDMIPRDDMWEGNLEYYQKGHKILLIDNFENKKISGYLKSNWRNLQEKHLICATKDKDEPLYNDRVYSFSTHKTPSATRIELDLNHEQFARAGYFREDKYLRCSGCLYRIHLNDFHRLIHNESTAPPVKRKKITHSSHTSCNARQSLDKKITTNEIPDSYNSQNMLSVIESDHNRELDILEADLQKRQVPGFSYAFVTKSCLRRTEGGNTFLSLVNGNKYSEVQRYLELKIYQEPEGEVIKSDPDGSIIATDPNSQIVDLLDICYELSELPDKFKALRTALINTIYQNRDVSSIHDHRDHIVKDVQKIKLLETIEPIIRKLFVKIEKVRNQVPSGLDSSASASADDSPNEMALMNHQGSPEIKSMLKLLQMQGSASPEDQEEIRNQLQALLAEIKVLSTAAAEQGLALVFCSQEEENPYRDIFSCAPPGVKNRELHPINNLTQSPQHPARHVTAREEEAFFELLKKKSDQLHASMERAELLLAALSECVWQPIYFILGFDYFALDKEIRKKIFLETPFTAEDGIKESPCSSSRCLRRSGSLPDLTKRHDK